MLDETLYKTALQEDFLLLLWAKQNHIRVKSTLEEELVIGGLPVQQENS